LTISLNAGNVETARVLSGSGGWMVGASCETLTSVAQSCPVGLTTNTQYVNWSGFLQSFVMFPDLDADNDGLVDENDLDDDNDKLADRDEITGRLFVPATPTDSLIRDSDNDGHDDLFELLAGTNPRDPLSALRISTISPQEEAAVIKWLGREGYRYRLLAGASVGALASNAVSIGEFTAPHGTGIWQQSEMIGKDQNLQGVAQRFYRLAVFDQPGGNQP